jgi:hypothetical protein
MYTYQARRQREHQLGLRRHAGRIPSSHATVSAPVSGNALATSSAQLPGRGAGPPADTFPSDTAVCKSDNILDMRRAKVPRWRSMVARITATQLLAVTCSTLPPRNDPTTHDPTTRDLLPYTQTLTPSYSSRPYTQTLMR